MGVILGLTLSEEHRLRSLKTGEVKQSHNTPLEAQGGEVV
jgi:hypothetical protein